MPRRRPAFAFFSMLLFISLTAQLLAGCGAKSTRSGQGKTGGAQAAQAPVPVLAANVEPRDILIELSAIGTVQSIQTVTVKPQVDGQLQTVHVKDGEDVAQGQLLFTIDPRPFEAQLNQALANLAADTAKSNQAAADNRRYSSLIKSGAVTVEETDAKRAAAEALSAQVKADQAAIEMARLKLEYCKIKSPLAGRAGQILVDAGNTVKTNDTELVVINQMQPIEVTFSIPETQLTAVRAAQAAGRPDVSAVPSGQSGPASIGKLTFIDNQVDAQTGTIKLRATFANEDRRLWPGEFVQVKVVLRTERGVLVVPSQAVQTSQQGNFIYVIKPDMRVEHRPVTTERYGEHHQIVRKGAQAGERIVSDGHLRLVPGALVDIKSSLDGGAGPSNTATDAATTETSSSNRQSTGAAQ